MRAIRKVKIAALVGLAFGALLIQKPCFGADENADAARLSDGGSGVDWAGYGGTFGEQHFSPLTQVNEKNVARLGLKWWIDLKPGNSVSAPIEIDGTLYFVTGYSIVHAADVRTGRQLWEYNPKVPEVAGRKLRLAWGSRGLAWWQGKIYIGTQDGRLIAIDARTGTPVWSVMTVEPDDTNYITGAPRIFDGKVIIGFGGADFGPARGYVTTYDAETGKLLWRWFTVPGNPANGFENKAMEMAAKTWSGEWWKYGGGGTVWNAMSYDPETNTVFLGTGNGSPWNHKARSAGKGDNLFLCSIVALDGATGTYKWHYQVNPGESWDYNAAMDMALAELKIDGQKRKVLMTAPKNGFFYVIDRITGKLISAEPFAKVNWASKIDIATGRPVENPAARYPNGSTFIMWPGSLGAHSWRPMAFSPKTGLAYIPVNEKAESYADYGLENDRWRRDMPVSTAQTAAIVDIFPKVDDPIEGTSRLDAWNVQTQKRVWSQPNPGSANGGVMATAGNLVFQGQLDSRFNAYAADTGKLLWSFDAKAPIIAPPISYSVEGHQYITVLTGIGTNPALLGPLLVRFNIDYRTQARRVLTFELDGKEGLPPSVVVTSKPVADPEYRRDDTKAGQGIILYGRCAICHGIDVVAGGAAPDLRASDIPLSAEAFRSVVKDGALLSAGMPRFEELTDTDLDNLRQYFRSRAQVWREALQHGNSPQPASQK